MKLLFVISIFIFTCFQNWRCLSRCRLSYRDLKKIGSFHKGYPAKNHPQARPAGWRALLAKWSFWQIVSPMHFGLLLLVFQFQKDSLQIFNRVRFFSQKKTSQPEPHKPHDSTIYIYISTNKKNKSGVKKKRCQQKPKTTATCFQFSQVTPPTHLRPGCGGGFDQNSSSLERSYGTLGEISWNAHKTVGVVDFFKKGTWAAFFMLAWWMKYDVNDVIFEESVERIEIDLFFLRFFGSVWVISFGLFALFLFENISDKRPCFVRKDV